jgi:hypothetical protein
VNRADRKAWQSARTFADLCELTARWIEGDLGEQPGYYGPTDIDDAEMVPVLAALNRAGCMTIQSQAGESGENWQQCAAVEGFADATAARRIAGIAETGWMTVVVHEPPRWSQWRFRRGAEVTAQWISGRPGTAFGTGFPRRFLNGEYGMCDRDAVRELCDAWQVAVIGPEPGRRSLLWAVLSVFAGSAA